MTFNPGSQLDTSQVSRRSSGGMGGPIKVGGGIGSIAVLILGVILFGPGFINQGLGEGSSYDYSQVGEQDSGPSLAEQCQTGEDANRNIECRVVGTVNSLNTYWDGGASRLGVRYHRPEVVLTSGSWHTGCGAASSAMGPFYCPADETAYFDVGFFDQLRSQYGAGQGPLAEEYVIAHEFGHHIQRLTGDINRAQHGDTGPQSSAVRLELQADCYAGVWASNASKTKDAGTGEPYLQPLTASDIRSAVSAAEAVGDDRIQEKAQGRVTPENFTHGSSEQRETWFMRGYEYGDPAACDTFSAGRI
ncbi:hypothetical protein F7P83_11165 [Brevibacterium luteolum]|nr:hypothetical protein [Brevibacterium luteolum]